jgi:4-diphosphocytidyl-2-C-methyl-D-erythritol kinase
VTRAVKLRTHAKVNLFLRVFGKRPDGYHEVETILHGINLADDIEITPTSTGQVDIDVAFSDRSKAPAPSLQHNIIYQAAQTLIAAGGKNHGVAIRLLKRIPIGAGLGGGSGNAAGALVMLSELWGMRVAHSDLLELAASLGSDVSYCIDGGTALATSRGETLTRLPSAADMWFVLGISDEPLLTEDVYGEWDLVGTTPDSADSSSVPMTLALGAGDVGEIATLLHNDLEPVVFGLRTELRDKKQALLDAGALGATVSGSGPTVFGIASTEARAHEIADEVKGLFDRVLVVRTKHRCIERLD